MPKIKKRASTRRLTTPAVKQKFIDNAKEHTKAILNIIAQSEADLELKEALADYMVLMLNALDIEHERLRFDKIAEKTPTRARRKLLKG